MRLLIFLFLLPIIFSQNIWNPEGTIIKYNGLSIRDLYSVTSYSSAGPSYAEYTASSCGGHHAPSAYFSKSSESCSCPNSSDSITCEDDGNYKAECRELDPFKNFVKCELETAVCHYVAKCKRCPCECYCEFERCVDNHNTIIEDRSRIVNYVDFSVNVEYFKKAKELFTIPWIDKDIKNKVLYWYSKPIFHLHIIDISGDSDKVKLTGGDIKDGNVNLQGFTINANYKYSKIEEFKKIYFQILDEDICYETDNFYFLFLVDNLGPRFLRILKHPLMINSSFFSLYDDLPNAVYINYKFLGNKNISFIIPGLSYCKFFKDSCFKLEIADAGSELESSSIKGINSYNKKTYISKESLYNLVNRDLIIDSYNFKYFNKNVLINLKAVDRVGNTKKFNIYLPYEQPKSNCKILFKYKGYTSLNNIRCSLSFSDYKNYGKINFVISKKPLNNLELIFDLMSLHYKLKENNRFVPFNTLILSGNSSTLGFLKKELNKSGEYYIYYFGEDYFYNVEGVTKLLDKQNLISSLTPNLIHTYLDVTPPVLYISSDGLLLNNIPLINYPVDNINQPLNFSLVPFNLSFTCKDKETNYCKIIVELDNGSIFEGINNLKIKIDYQPFYIDLIYKDIFNNTKKKTLNFKVNEETPNITISFNETPLDNYYTFTKDVTLFVKATFENSINKIKEIKIISQDNNKVLAHTNSGILKLPISCDLGKKCEYKLLIKAVSKINTISTKTINVVINKKAFIVNIKPIDGEPYIIRGDTYYFKKIDPSFYILCFIDRNIVDGNILYAVINKELKIENSEDKNPLVKIFSINLNENICPSFVEGGCRFSSLNKNLTVYNTLKYCVDKEPPSVIIKDKEGNVLNEKIININNSKYLNIYIQIEDNKSGLNKVKLLLDNTKLGEFNKNNIHIKKLIEEGNHKLTIIACDNLGNCVSKIFNVYVDYSPPIIKKVLLTKKHDQEKYLFSCQDISGCKITKVICNGEEKIINKPSVEITCKFNKKGFIKWEICAEDYNNISSCIKFADSSISSPVDIYTIPNTLDIFCILDELVPIYFIIKNKQPTVIKIKPIVVRGLSLNSRQIIELKPFSTYNYLDLFLCKNGKADVIFQIDLYNTQINISKEVYLKPVFFNLFD